MKWIVAVLAILVLLTGCSMLQLEEGITGVADGPVGTSVVTVGKGLASFLPSPFREGVLVLVGLFGFIRGRRYKRISETLVDGVNEVLKPLKDSEAKVIKATLKTVASDNNLQPVINKIVDARK